MPHVLLVSYHFPPLNVVSSFRAEAFARYLPAHGFRVTVLTLRWELIADGRTGEGSGYAWHPPGTTPLVEEQGGYRVIRLPRTRDLRQRLLDNALRVPFLRSIVVLTAHATGRFQLSTLYAHRAMRAHLRRHAHQERFDLVLATMTPDEHLALGAWLHKRLGIPFVGDHRDAYDNRIMSPTFRPDLPTRITLFLKRWWHRHWMRQSALLTSVSAPMVETLVKATGAPKGLEVRNGYFPERMHPDPARIDAHQFLITYGGRIYPDQDPGVFLDAIVRFMELLSPDERTRVKVLFQGVQDEAHAQRIESRLPAEWREVQRRRIPHSEMVDRLAASSILVVMDLKTPGAFTGKFMDYLGCHRNILMVPSDHGVIADLIRTSGTGLATDDADAAARFLLERFREWQRDGRPVFRGDPGMIEQCARPAQVAILAKALRSLLRAEGAPSLLS